MTDSATLAAASRAPRLSRARLLFAVVAVLLGASSFHAAPAPAAFGITAFTGGAFDADGTSFTQAAGHPHSASATIEFPSAGFIDPDGQPKDTVVDLPPGFIGNPEAVPTVCTFEQLDDPKGNPLCPVSSQVGVVFLRSSGTPFVEGANVYSMVPPPGHPAAFGFRLLDAKVMLFPSVRSGGDYGITVNAREISQVLAIGDVSLTFWGVPADPSHDAERGSSVFGQCGAVGPDCANPAGYPPAAFLTVPSDCSAGALSTTLYADEWANPGNFTADGRPDLADPAWKTASFDTDTNGNPTTVTGCEKVPFDPDISLQPTTHEADSPSGLEVELSVPTDGLTNTSGLAQANLKRAVVTLPEGMSVNPSSADGLGACTAAQVRLDSALPDQCPEDAKIGSVEIDTPLLEDTLEGSVYLAKQHDNPFDSLLALYIAVDDPDTGLVVKLPGRVDPDPVSGRLQATFDDNPQVPFESFRLHFKAGSRAPLITPPTCGTYTTSSALSSWSAVDPDAPTVEETVVHTASFQITSGPHGAPCPGSDDFDPAFQAGTLSPIAAAYSPLVVKASRPDGSQVLRGLELDLPAGLTARLAEIPACSDAALAAAPSRAGAVEAAAPSCPADSRLGSVNVAAGAGPIPVHVTGTAYLAGPYKGAPLSVAVITPALAGPFDLGTVVVRAAAQIDPVTTKVHVTSDPIPQVLEGILLHVRSVAVDTDRPNFFLNPTDCDPMALDGVLFGTSVTRAVSNHFQVGACGDLGFRPKLSLRLKGKVRRTANPKLIATLTAKPGETNIARAQVKLPPAAFLDNAHIKTICTRVQFAAEACPPGSIYGRATANSPLLDYPLSGNVYLRSSDNPLPDLVAALRGPAYQPIEVDLVGRTDSVKGALRNTFDAVPDAPVSSFRLELFGGKRGLVEMSGGFCSNRHASIKLDGHSGKVFDTAPVVKAASCGTKARSKRRSGN